MATKPIHEWIGLTNAEARKANSKFREYANTYHLTTVSDKSLLEDYVYLDVFGERILEQIHKLSDGDDKTIIPKDLMEQYHNNLEQKLILADKLGFGEIKKQSSWLEFWSRLKEKAKLYSLENRGLCTAKCPYCKKLFLLLKKIDDYESFDFTMFKGTILYNKKLMELIDQKKLTMEEVSEIWGLQNTDYVNGIFNKIYLKEKSSQSSAV